MTIIILHGLFGNKNSLLQLGYLLKQKINYPIILLDLRNHGQSTNNMDMRYSTMAHDVVETLNFLNINQKVILIGYSMGGKVAMYLTTLLKNIIYKIIILDIAPITYVFSLKNIFLSFKKIHDMNITTKIQAYNIMKLYITDHYTINILLDMFNNGHWEFNWFFIQQQYRNISGWNLIYPWLGKIMFLKGKQSNYIKLEYYKTIFKQFPYAIIYNINAGHFMHITHTYDVLQQILIFLEQ
ncbi:alpha/beta fold hydrolase [Enterobacteriaceae endosymbiont of Macroplea appendiculata]|uniref:alpha/beta fold hydrolase n=1 Tax=Enterobacteriaceae endosymbiont of Macroplea appendiculata TaxID=2675790 RepID=UPI0014572179|nr:alpha/beta fold hydrolase [Enterobacteriaceae endosymbiont of Macroplea appendiculata]